VYDPRVLSPSGRKQRVLTHWVGHWGDYPCEWFVYPKGVYCRVRRDRFGRVLVDGFYPTVWPLWSDPRSWEEFMGNLIKKAFGSSSAKKPSFDAQRDTVLQPFPALTEFLTYCGNGKGETRETATLNVSFCSEGFTVMLKDRETARLTFGQGDTLGDALTGLEARLADGSAVWRADQFGKPGKGKKGG